MTTATSLKYLFEPKSLAVIGVSRSPQKVGYQITKNIINFGYSGKLFLVNPNASQILDQRVYASINHLPSIPEMVIIVTPAPIVTPIAAQCASLGVKVAVIISAGFSESGLSGKSLQQDLRNSLNSNSMHILGPNCLGVINPYSNLNATFGPHQINRGSIFLISQSGALITSILDYASQRHLGFSKAVSLGNRIDINENDLLDFAKDDHHTKVIAVYLESFASGREFFFRSSHLVSKKPIVFLKGGSSRAGQIASASHTASLATDSVLISALCHQTGVLECNSIESWLSACQLLSAFPTGLGNRLGLVSNAGGPAVLTTDYAQKLGFTLPKFSSKAIRALTKLNISSTQNPLDVLGDASPETFNQALKVISKETNLDVLYGLITPQAMTQPVKIARTLSQNTSLNKKPFIVSFIGGSQVSRAKIISLSSGIPTYDFPNDGLEAIKISRDYRLVKSNFPSLLSIPTNPSPKYPPEKLTVQADYFSLLTAYGFTLPRYRYVDALESVPETLNYVARPAVAKTADPHLAHKAAVGGVITDIMTVSAARLAFRHLRRLYHSILFQQSIISSIELILGGRNDPQLGPFITVGLGGALTDIFADRAYFFLPTNYQTFIRLFSKTKASMIMRKKGLNQEFVFSAIKKVSSILIDFPQLKEIEINPLLLSQNHYYPVDIKLNF